MWMRTFPKVQLSKVDFRKKLSSEGALKLHEFIATNPRSCQIMRPVGTFRYRLRVENVVDVRLYRVKCFDDGYWN